MSSVPSGTISSLPPHSDNPETELPLVIQALTAIYSTNSSTSTNGNRNEPSLTQRDLADKYLTSFQRHPVSWIVCDRILSNVSQEGPHHFFAAQTIHSKCRTDVVQLPAESLGSLRDSLLVHLSNYTKSSSSSSKGPIVTRLAMALCALGVQMGWVEMITDIMGRVKAGMEGDGKVAHGMSMVVALELFRLLPEECNSDRLLLLDELHRNKFRTVLRESSSQILDFLWYLVQLQQQDVNGSHKVTEGILQCFHSWIKYVDIPPKLLEASPLIEWNHRMLLSGSTNAEGETFELAVDVVVEIIRCYPSDERSHTGLVHKMIPLVMALGSGPSPENIPFRVALREEDEDGTRAYCRIFTEMGESYMSLIMGHEELNQVALVDLVLDCSAIPDNEIATITLHFWYRFVSWLEEIEPYEYRQIQIDHYTPQLIKLVTTCTSLMRYPSDLETLTTDRVDDIHKDRYYVSDTLEDCCRLLGGDMVIQNIGDRLKAECQLVSSLPSEKQLLQWHGIESCIFALRGISRFIAADESTVLPFVMSIIPQLPAEVKPLRTTANLAVGEYAFWLDGHSDHLHPILPYLAQGLSEQKCASSAAVAIKHLCENCGTKLSLGDSVLDLYDGIVAAQQVQPVLELRDELEVLEGACKAVSRHLEEVVKRDPSAEAVSAYVGRIVKPIGSRLVMVASPESTMGIKQVCSEIERLTVVVRFLSVPRVGAGASGLSAEMLKISGRTQFLLNLMQESWRYLDAITQKFPNDISLAEKLCRLHKHVLRGCGAAAFQPMLEPLRDQLVRNYAQSHLSPYLYAASICITEYGNDSNYSQLLFEMLTKMSNTTFDFLKSIGDFTAHPDVVEELFFLAGRMMTYCPQPLVLSPLLTSFLQCAIVGLKLDHRDSNRGIMNFLENLVSYSLSISSDKSSTNPDQIACGRALEKIITEVGQDLVTNLVQALLGYLPCYRIDSSFGSIAGILFKLNQLCQPLLLEWTNGALSSVPDPAKTNFLNELANPHSKEKFFQLVRAFSSFCIRNRKIGGR